MSLKIIKLSVTTETKFSISPAINRYFFETTTPILSGTTLKIDASNFVDDTGVEVVMFPPLNLNNSYFNVYINGVLQMDGNFAYTAGENGVGNLLVSVPEGSEIQEHVPIILEIVNFDPFSNTRTDT
jgi:hypothetical protein